MTGPETRNHKLETLIADNLFKGHAVLFYRIISGGEQDRKYSQWSLTHTHTFDQYACVSAAFHLVIGGRERSCSSNLWPITTESDLIWLM